MPGTPANNGGRGQPRKKKGSKMTTAVPQSKEVPLDSKRIGRVSLDVLRYRREMLSTLAARMQAVILRMESLHIEDVDIDGYTKAERGCTEIAKYIRSLDAAITDKEWTLRHG